jgi:hypothetical protein
MIEILKRHKQALVRISRGVQSKYFESLSLVAAKIFEQSCCLRAIFLGALLITSRLIVTFCSQQQRQGDFFVPRKRKKATTTITARQLPSYRKQLATTTSHYQIPL